ncbi:putative ATPase [Candidatus Electrothrix marina]|uniref:Putative ATPase n=1 Tax=Candidatus Electrothrix marina TaxID=1859130 RepID=A0A444JFL3_9BACT|nr:putative ATPase [Candidatus Electrothrix marina]
MIRNVNITAFKSLLDVSVELGKINVFIGANGSGKSNFLEAIGVLGAAANGRVDDEALMRRGVRPGVPALYKSSFTGTKMRNAIRLEAIADNASYAVELNNPIQNPEPAWTFKNESLKQEKLQLVGRSPATKNRRLNPQQGLAALKAVELLPEEAPSRLIRELADYAIYTANTNTLRGLILDTQQRDPVGLAGGRLPQAVLSLFAYKRKAKWMTQVFSDIHSMIDWEKSFGARSAGDALPLSPSVAASRHVVWFRDRFMAEKRNGLTGYDASEGALYVLFAAALATLPEAPPVLAIDNMDHGLNPRLARALMEKICSWIFAVDDMEKQLLLTTHNPLVLDGLPLDNDEVRLFAVDRSRKGRTIIRRVYLTPDDLQRDGEYWTVSRLWVTGHLGGVPNV